MFGLGEISIYLTDPSNAWSEQLLKLGKVLTVLPPEHVHVLHCSNETSLSKQVLAIVFNLLQINGSVQKSGFNTFTASPGHRAS